MPGRRTVGLAWLVVLPVVWVVAWAAWPVAAQATAGAPERPDGMGMRSSSGAPMTAAVLPRGEQAHADVTTPPAGRMSRTKASGGTGAVAVAGELPVQDEAGRSASRGPARVKRIVSLSPALTETVCVLGACDRLVGVDRHSNWPDSIRDLPRLGGHPSLNVEGILALRPDLVLVPAGQGNEPVVARLKQLGIPVESLGAESWEDIGQVLRAVARTLGLPGQTATAVWQQIERQVQQEAAAMPESARGWRVYVEVDPTPYVAGPTSFMGQMLTRLGLHNVLTAEQAKGRAFVPLSREWVLQADPDLMMVSDPGDAGLAALQARPGWGRLKAVRLGRACLFSGKALDVLVRPGPRVAEGARLMRGCARRSVLP